MAGSSPGFGKSRSGAVKGRARLAPGVSNARPLAPAVTIPQRSAADISAREAQMRAEYRIDAATEERAVAAIRRVIAESDVVTYAPGDLLGRILDTGVKNQHASDTNKVGSEYIRPIRAAWEEGAFGIPSGSPPEDYPVYGILSSRIHTHPSEDGKANSYGTVRIQLRPEVRSRTTVSAGDSLGRTVMPSPLDSPRLAAIGDMTDKIANPGPKIKSIGDLARSIWYFEAQIHGGVQASDIASVIFRRAEEATPELRAKLDSLGIAYTIDTSY